MRPLIPLFCTSGDVCSGFKSQDESIHLLPSLLARDGFLKFIFGVTPVDLSESAWQPSVFDPLTFATIGGAQIYATVCGRQSRSVTVP